MRTLESCSAKSTRANTAAPRVASMAFDGVQSRDALVRFGDLLGSSEPMRLLYAEITRVAATDAAVLVVGESGTGKDLIARAVHAASRRRERSFVAVNCGAIPSHMLEAELFGHEKGSFTGAYQQHAGYFERATGGTLFLDEVTEMAADMQVKLLRVLETGRFFRVGGSVPVDVDLRIVAATNKDPSMAGSPFRRDLLYRLAVFPMRAPSLRERDDDVVRLARHFLADLNRKAGTDKRLSRRALAVLTRHTWPGNVRELRNAVQRGFILADTDDVELPEPSTRAGAVMGSRSGRLDIRIGTALSDAQRQIILATLAHVDGNKSEAADALGISLKTLYNRLQLYGPGLPDADGERPSSRS